MLELGRQIGEKISVFKGELTRSKEEAIFAWEKEASELFGGFVAVRGKLDGSPVDFRIISRSDNKVISYEVNGEKCQMEFPDTEDYPFDRNFAMETVSKRLEGRLDHEYMMIHDKNFLCNRGPFTVLIGIPLGPKKVKDPNEAAWG